MANGGSTPGRRIPVANIYYLLCYAWDSLVARDLVSIDSERGISLVDLLANVLEAGVRRLLKRGVSRTYQECNHEMPGIRGRLDISASLKRATFSRASAICSYDELSPDTLPNQIIKSTLRDLSRAQSLDPRIAEKLTESYLRLADISTIRVAETAFRSVERQKKVHAYSFLLDVCELIHRNLISNERTGETLFRDFADDDEQMAGLFERFLLRFYATEQSALRVHAKQLAWDARGDAEHIAYMPRMRTDICLSNAWRTIIIDAKYYAVALSERFGKESIRSAHLYQLFTYMHHMRRLGGAGRVEGILIYPRTTRSLNLAVEISEFPVRVAVINLDQPWQSIHADLLQLLKEGNRLPRA